MPPGCPLHPAELRTLTLIAEGLTYKQAAHRAGVAQSTIRTQVHNAMRRLDVPTSALAVLACFRGGWIRVDWPKDEGQVIRELLLDLAAAVRYHQPVTGPQRDYLDAFIAHIRARNDLDRRRARAAADLALVDVLTNAGLTSVSRRQDLTALLARNLTEIRRAA